VGNQIKRLWSDARSSASGDLAAAYGVAVSMTMAITTILVAKIAHKIWKWNAWLIGSITTSFLIVDLAFLGANMLKFVDGGWFPLVVGGIIFTIMTTWRHGRELLWRRLRTREKPLPDFLKSIAHKPPARVPGTSIFLTGRMHGTPAVLMHHVKHNKALSEEVILLDVAMADIPHVSPGERCACELHTQGFCRVILKFGFMDELDVPKAIRKLKRQEKELDLDEVTYYIGRQTPIPTIKSVGMAPWRERLFAFMARNATHAVDFFKLPPNQVVELGLEVEI
jgi:KUP system potassium uptake protein